MQELTASAFVIALALSFTNGYTGGSQIVIGLFAIVGIVVGWTIVPLAMSGSEKFHSSALRRTWIRLCCAVAVAFCGGSFGLSISGDKQHPPANVPVHNKSAQLHVNPTSGSTRHSHQSQMSRPTTLTVQSAPPINMPSDQSPQQASTADTPRGSGAQTPQQTFTAEQVGDDDTPQTSDASSVPQQSPR